MGANDFRQALSDVRVQETCFHGRHSLSGGRPGIWRSRI